VPPAGVPIGLLLADCARLVSRAFDQALVEAGGSLPVWLVLLNLKINPTGSQRQLATAIGVREATLTHHLNAMERDGLVIRRRDELNRRVHVVELTGDGEKSFRRLARAASAFDVRLRGSVGAEDIAKLGSTLRQMAQNIASDETRAAAPWTDAMDKR
jgi:MarR family transcriptional regulator, transcriptional regulator for hemolysin